MEGFLLNKTFPQIGCVLPSQPCLDNLLLQRHRFRPVAKGPTSVGSLLYVQVFGRVISLPDFVMKASGSWCSSSTLGWS